MPTGPTVRRRRLGTELRKLRENSGRTIGETATALGTDPAAVSRIEAGKAPAGAAHLSQILDMYDVSDPGARELLVGMAREGHRKGWWADYGDVLPSGLDIHSGVEAEAAGIRAFEVSAVHSLLQTPDYARAALQQMFPRHAPAQIDRLVTLRLMRQRRLDDASPPDLWVILDEAVIRRAVGDEACMKGQLKHLAAESARQPVTVQVLPFTAGAHPGCGGAFSVMEFPEGPGSRVVCIESFAGSIYLEKERDVKTREEAFSRLQAAAMPPAESLALISEAAGKLP